MTDKADAAHDGQLVGMGRAQESWQTMTKDEAKKFLRENGFCETHGVKLSHRTENGYWGERRIIYCPLCELADAVVRRKREEAIDKQAEQARRVLGI